MGVAMNLLTPRLNLLFYDYPQVFTAKDKVDCYYVCMVVEELESGPLYLALQISNKRLRGLLSGALDLRAIYQFPEISLFRLAEFQEDGETLAFTGAAYDMCPVEYLPDEGLYFDEDEIAGEALEHNSPVSHIGLSVKEAEKNAQIGIAKLSEFLALYQNVLKHLARIAAKEIKCKINRKETPFNVDVYGFSHGSFTVHVKSSYQCDLFGDNALLAAAYSKLNSFIELAESPESAVIELQKIKGHAANSIIKLVEFVDSQCCPLTHSWASPSTGRSEKRNLSVSSAKALAELCRQRNDLFDEEIVLEGSIVRANEEANTWKMTNLRDGKRYSGEVDPESGLSMTGVIIGKEIYRFYCRERVEVVLGTGQEVTRLRVYKIEKNV